MTEDQKLALGSYCTGLLGDETFQALIDLYSQQCAFDLLNTEPKHKEERESIYASYQGFTGFLALLTKYASDHAKRIHKLNVEETTPVDEDDQSVHDIYGMNTTDDDGYHD